MIIIAATMAIAGFSLQDKLGKCVAEEELVWRTYMAAKALPTTKRIELFNAKEFATVALGNNDNSLCGLVLEAKNVLVMVPTEYSNHINVSSPDSTGATQVHRHQQ